jgi:ABC-type methionine transport system permease subunit
MDGTFERLSFGRVYAASVVAVITAPFTVLIVVIVPISPLVVPVTTLSSSPSRYS